MLLRAAAFRMAWSFRSAAARVVTDEGRLYLATIEELFSRRLLGYAMSQHHDAALTGASLQIAVATRSGDVNG